MALLKSDTVSVSRKDWEALQRDVHEIKEIVMGMASAMNSMADATTSFANSPVAKMLGNMFPSE